MEDFVVLERAGDVGGTWRDNTYPGCQCDVPSALYSFSFAPNPDWSHTYPLQPELGAYVRRTAERHGVLDHVLFRTPLQDARWDDERQRWEIDTPTGRLTADVLVMANGPLSEPKLPDVPGLDRFRGTTFHSAAWNHDHDLSGQRVAVVGTGASAIQFVPLVQPEVGELVLFQRTPAWVLPHPGRRVPGWERWLYRRLPVLQRLRRYNAYWAREALILGFAKNPRLMKGIEFIARKHLERQVPDPELRAKLTPRFTAGCKRLLLSNDWYPALTQPNVTVVASGVTEVREHSVVAADGTEHEVDTLRWIEANEDAVVEVSAEALDSYNESVQARMAPTVWNVGGCASWYQDDHGRNPTLWPDYTWKFCLDTRRFDGDRYVAHARRSEGELEAVA
jgi:cation diffusion facilitator CzcD-associated flavoprotein CzcO